MTGSRDRVRRAEQHVAAYELRLRGLTYREIGTAMNVPFQTVHTWCADLAATRTAESREALVAFELDRLDRYLTKLEEQIENGRAVARNIETALRVGERRAKLLGLDAATKVETTVTEVGPVDLALAELIREAEAAASAEEQRIRDGGE